MRYNSSDKKKSSPTNASLHLTVIIILVLMIVKLPISRITINATIFSSHCTQISKLLVIECDQLEDKKKCTFLLFPCFWMINGVLTATVRHTAQTKAYKFKYYSFLKLNFENVDSQCTAIHHKAKFTKQKHSAFKVYRYN